MEGHHPLRKTVVLKEEVRKSALWLSLLPPELSWSLNGRQAWKQACPITFTKACVHHSAFYKAFLKRHLPTL